MSGGKGNAKTETRIRYAKYVESKHKDFLNEIVTRRNAAIDNSPYEDIDDVPYDVGFFGTGFLLADFPSLYDMYGKFMAGLDIEDLFNQVFEDTVNGANVGILVDAERDLMDDDIEQTIIPRYQVGMRDINSVVSSSFVVGKSIIEAARTKQLAKFSAELRYRLIPVAEARWGHHLDWNKAVVMTYAELMKFYFSGKMDMEQHNQNVVEKNALWPFTVLEYERAALGALQGATNSKQSGGGGGKATGAISGALSGAAMGGMIGPMVTGAATGGPPGAMIGGVLGLAAGLIG